MLRDAKWYYNRVKAYISRPRLLVQVRPVVIDDSSRCESPLFLLGTHRSGTSLVRRIFNSHPLIACPPETYLLSNYIAMLNDPMVADGYAGFGMDGEAMRRDLARKASDLHEAYRLAVGKPIWADKTPQYVSIASELDRLFDYKARFVIILRHPLDVVHSQWRRGWRFNDIEDGFVSTLTYVRDSLDTLEQFAQTVEGRCARIYYDRLCDDPEAELTQALEALGMAFDPAMLSFAEQDHNFGVEDPVVRGNKPIEASHGAYKGWTRDQMAQAEAIFGERAFEDRYWI